VSTYPPTGLYTRDAETIARVMASRKVSPKGIGSAIRMVQFFINRAGRRLAPARRRELERAKRLLQQMARGDPVARPGRRDHWRTCQLPSGWRHARA
jgi:hypothetical protein